jgi:hypothetical protein
LPLKALNLGSMKKVFQLLQVLMIASVLPCCATKPPVIVTEVSKHDRTPTSARYQRDGNTLVIFPKNRPGVGLVGAKVEVIDGDVYLDPVNGYAPGPTRVEIDLSSPSIPYDWSRRLYWINSAEFDPLKLLRRTKVFRTPIKVE